MHACNVSHNCIWIFLLLKNYKMLITTYELFKKHSFETSSVQFIFDILKNIKLFNLHVYFQNLDSIAYPHPAKYVQPRVASFNYCIYPTSWAAQTFVEKQCVFPMQVNQRQSIDLRSPYCIIGQGIPFLGDFKGEYVNHDHSWHWHSQDALLKSGTYYCSKNQGIIWTHCAGPHIHWWLSHPILWA